jgi:hypothetical protein
MRQADLDTGTLAFSPPSAHCRLHPRSDPRRHEAMHLFIPESPTCSLHWSLPLRATSYDCKLSAGDLRLTAPSDARSRQAHSVPARRNLVLYALPPGSTRALTMRSSHARTPGDTPPDKDLRSHTCRCNAGSPPSHARLHKSRNVHTCTTLAPSSPCFRARRIQSHRRSAVEAAEPSLTLREKDTW